MTLIFLWDTFDLFSLCRHKRCWFLVHLSRNLTCSWAALSGWPPEPAARSSRPGEGCQTFPFALYLPRLDRGRPVTLQKIIFWWLTLPTHQSSSAAPQKAASPGNTQQKLSTSLLRCNMRWRPLSVHPPLPLMNRLESSSLLGLGHFFLFFSWCRADVTLIALPKPFPLVCLCEKANKQAHRVITESWVDA